MRYLTLVLTVLASSYAEAGSPQIAGEIRNEYEAATARWAEQIRSAADAAQQMEIWDRRPGPNEYGERMWGELRSSLSEDWTLEYCAWILEHAPVFAAQPPEGGAGGSPMKEILRAVERFHLKSPKVGRLCLSLTALPDPQTLAVVEKVGKENPDRAVQGQAALATAMLLKGLGDGRDVMVRRLSRLREAIIKAADVEVGEVSVAKLAEDEIYVIQNLSKGRTAPDIVGRDVSGTPFKLSQVSGKVTVVAFWHSNMRDAERGIELLRKLHETHGARGMELIGVTTDPAPVLRMLKRNGRIPWRNFADASGRITSDYRVRNLPLVYVLDRERTIHYIGGPGTFVDLTVEALLAE